MGSKVVILIFCPDDNLLFYVNQKELNPPFLNEEQFVKWKNAKGTVDVMQSPITFPDRKFIVTSLIHVDKSNASESRK
jgi:hypothetical protein